MPRNGSGTYSLPSGNPVVTGTVISSTWANNTLADIATALSNSLSKDGQTTATGNLPMGGNKITGLGAPTLRTDAAQLASVQNSQATNLGNVAGTVTITADATPALTAYTAGQTFRFTPAGTNTGATTININGLGAKNIFWGGVACTGFELSTAYPAEIWYDGTQFNLLSINRKSGYVLLASQVVGAGGTLNVDFVANSSAPGFSSTYDKYIVEFNAKPETDGCYLYMRIGTGGTPTFQAGVSSYIWGMAVYGAAGASGDGSTASGGALIALTEAATNLVGNDTAEHVSGTVEYTDPDATDYPLFNFRTTWINTSGLGNGATGSGNYGAGVAITGLRFGFSNASDIAEGSWFRLYGMVK